jgi:hypothetical protein
MPERVRPGRSGAGSGSDGWPISWPNQRVNKKTRLQISQYREHKIQSAAQSVKKQLGHERHTHSS